MARIPNYMLYYRGERVSFINVFTLDTPEIVLNMASDNASYTVSLASRQAGVVYLYTLDGSEPNENSPVFVDGMSFNDGASIRVQGRRGFERSVVSSLNVERVETPDIYDANKVENVIITITNRS